MDTVFEPLIRLHNAARDDPFEVPSIRWNKHVDSISVLDAAMYMYMYIIIYTFGELL